MATQNANGKEDFLSLIKAVWAPQFYSKLKNDLILANLFSRDYEGEIKAKGDTVKVNQISVGSAETLSNDKVQFSSQKVVVTPFELTVNRQTVHAVEISNLALLQSEEFMQELMKEMTYEIMFKMESEIIAYYNSQVTNVINPTAASDFAAVDIAKIRTAQSKAKLPMTDRYTVLSPDYYGDLLTKNQIISSDFVDGRPFQDQKLPTLLGNKVFEHNALATDTGMSFHKSALQLAMQKELSFDIVNLKSNNKLAQMVVCDIVWDMKMFDKDRAWKLKEA